MSYLVNLCSAVAPTRIFLITEKALATVLLWVRGAKFAERRRRLSEQGFEQNALTESMFKASPW